MDSGDPVFCGTDGMRRRIVRSGSLGRRRRASCANISFAATIVGSGGRWPTSGDLTDGASSHRRRLDVLQVRVRAIAESGMRSAISKPHHSVSSPIKFWAADILASFGKLSPQEKQPGVVENPPPGKEFWCLSGAACASRARFTGRSRF